MSDNDYWHDVLEPGEAREMAEWRNSLPDPPEGLAPMDERQQAFWLRPELEVLRTELWLQFGIEATLDHSGGGIVLLAVKLPGKAFAWFDKEHLLRGYDGDDPQAWNYRVGLYRDGEDEEGVMVPLARTGKVTAELIGPWLVKLGAATTDPLTAYEVDNGPNGITWELQRGSKWIATVGSREQAESLGATVFHTLEEWYAEQVAQEEAAEWADEMRAAEVRERREGS